MSRPDERPEPDPAEVQPTDNSTGTPVDLDRAPGGAGVSPAIAGGAGVSPAIAGGAGVSPAIEPEKEAPAT